MTFITNKLVMFINYCHFINRRNLVTIYATLIYAKLCCIN